jgi:RNA 2',3'-cyclic 3'-phosphodiesterase
VRLFVALPLPDHVRVLVTAAVAPLRQVAPELTLTRPEGWHVTLAFLGEVADDEVEGVAATVGGAVADAGTGPSTCHLAGARAFGRGALAVEVEDDPAGAVASLGSEVQRALAGAGLPVQERPVRPHLTVARASRRGARVGDGEVAAVAPVRASWEADHVELVRSHLGRGPARYEAIGAWSLAGS